MLPKTLVSTLFVIGTGIFPWPTLGEIPKDSCQGTACEDVSIFWTDKGYEIRNDGIGPVRIDIKSWYGSSCGESRTIELQPGQIEDYGFAAFCSPISAVYLPN